eukprot:89302_1
MIYCSLTHKSIVLKTTQYIGTTYLSTSNLAARKLAHISIMDPTQLFATLKPILDDIHRLQQPSSNAKLFSKQWSQCTVSLDKLISLLSTYPSLMDTVHPIPNFSSSISCTIPPSYSSQTISKFTCVPYFIYTQNRAHPCTQVLNHFFGLICVPLSEFISIWFSNDGYTLNGRPPESVIIRILICWKLVFLKSQKIKNNANVMKDIFYKLMQFTFPFASNETSFQHKRIIMQCEEILFHTTNAWIALFLNIFPNQTLYKNVFLSNELKPAFGYILSNVLDLLRNENQFIHNTSVKLHCIYLLVIICQYMSQHCTQSSPSCLLSIIQNKQFMNDYQSQLPQAHTLGLKQCNGKGLDLLSAFIPGIIGNLMTLIDDHYNSYTVKSKIISVSISALTYVVSLTFNSIQKQQKMLYQKWKKQHQSTEQETHSHHDTVDLQALLSLTVDKEETCDQNKTNKNKHKPDGLSLNSTRNVEWISDVRSKLSLVFVNLYSVIFIDDEDADEDKDQEIHEEMKAFKMANTHGPKYASFFQHSRVRLSLVHNALRILSTCPLLEYQSLLIIFEFLITQMKIRLQSKNTIDETDVISKLIYNVLNEYMHEISSLSHELTQRVMDLMAAIPRFCKLQHEERSLLNLKLIYGYIHLLSPVSSLSYSNMFHHLLYALSVHYNAIYLIFEGHSHVLCPLSVLNDESPQHQSIPMYYEINLLYFKTDECKKLLYAICQSIGYIVTRSYANNQKRIVFKWREMVDPLLETLHAVCNENDAKRKQIQILLFAYNIWIGCAKYMHTFGITSTALKNELYGYFYDIIHQLLQPQYFGLPISNQSTLIKYLYQSESQSQSQCRNMLKKDDFDESQLRVLNTTELSQNAMIVSLVLRIFSGISYIFQDANYFDKYLMTILYPMIEKLSMTENDLIHHSALCTMHHIAFINGYESLDSFIINNSDYIMDRVSHQLHYSISKSYFASSSFDRFNSRTPQILTSLLSHTTSPGKVLPLLFDTVDHILNTLDALSRKTTSKIEHETPSVSLLNLDSKASRLSLDWKPSMAMTSTLILTQQNKELQHDISRKLVVQDIMDRKRRNVKLSSNDIRYVKKRMKQTWQLKCIQEYMKVLHCIIQTLAKKNRMSPTFLSNEESKTFDDYLSYNKTIDFNEKVDYLIDELEHYSNLLDGITPQTQPEEHKEDTEKDPFYRKRPDEPTTEQALVEKIMKRCMHFISSNVMETKYLSLCIMEQSVFVLSFRKKLLLPIIAQFWKSFTFVVASTDEEDKPIVLKGYDVLLVICDHCGAFIKRRFENDIWPTMKYNIRSNWKVVKKRLSNTDLDKTIEIKVINQILKCLISLLTVDDTKRDAIDNRLNVRDIETVRIMFAKIGNQVVSTLIPLLNDIATPLILVQNVTKVLLLFAKMIDKQMLWFNLFVLNPQFVANYYDKTYLDIKHTKLNDMHPADLKQFVMDNIQTVRKGNFNLYVQTLIKSMD